MTEPQIAQRINPYVEQQQQRDVQIVRQEDVAGDEHNGYSDDGNHGRMLLHPDGQQLVMDMVLVGHEGVLSVAYPMEIDPHHIEAGDDKGREGQDKGIGHIVQVFCRKAEQQAEAQETDGHTYRKAACISHKYLFTFVGIAEYIEIEEGDQHAKGGKCNHRIDIFMDDDKQNPVEKHGNAAEAGGKSVDAVNQVDGVDDKHHGKEGERIANPLGDCIDEKDAVQTVNPEPSANHEEASDNLCDELCFVADTNQVVGHTHQIENHDGTEAECQRTAFVGNAAE